MSLRGQIEREPQRQWKTIAQRLWAHRVHIAPCGIQRGLVLILSEAMGCFRVRVRVSLTPYFLNNYFNLFI